MNDCDSGPGRAIRAIEGYLLLHPQAADTERGIAERWMVEMGVDVPMPELLTAIEALLQRGVLAGTALPGGGSVYRAAWSASAPSGLAGRQAGPPWPH